MCIGVHVHGCGFLRVSECMCVFARARVYVCVCML
jgi:hypothetical protein